MAGLSRHALRRELANFVRVGHPDTPQWPVALQAAVSVAVATLLLAVFFGPENAVLGIIGCHLALTAPGRPVRDRAHVLAPLVAINAVVTSIGLATSFHPLLPLLVLPVVTAVAVLGYNAVIADPPGATFLIVGAVLASYLPSAGFDRVMILVASLLSPALSCLTSLGLDLLRGHHPESHALDAARRAVTEYVTADPNDDPVRLAELRDRAYASVLSTGMSVAAAHGIHAETKELAELRRLHLKVLQRVCRTRLNNAPIAVDRLEKVHYLGAPSARYLARRGLSRASLPWLSARRAGLSIGLAYGLALVLGMPDPDWAALTVALLLAPGTNRALLTHRAFHRLLGTILGMGVFFVIWQFHPAGYWLLFIEFGLMFLVQQTQTLNHAVSVVFMTPLVSLIAAAGPLTMPFAELIRVRVIETAIGVFATVVLIWAFSRLTPIVLARRQFRRSLNALLAVLWDLDAGKTRTAGGLIRRRDLLYEKLQTARILRIEKRELSEIGAWDVAEAELSLLCYVTLAVCWTTNPKQVMNAGEMARELQNMISALPPIGTTRVDPNAVAESLRKVWDARGGTWPNR